MCQRSDARIPSPVGVRYFRARNLVGDSDSEYACKTVARGLPGNVLFTGPACMGAALYQPSPPQAITTARYLEHGQAELDCRAVATRYLRRSGTALLAMKNAD